MDKIALALIEAAAWITRNEGDWDISVSTYGDSPTVTLSQWCYEEYSDETTYSSVENMARIRRSIGGQWDKDTNEYEFSLTRNVSDCLTVRLSVSRNAACTPRVVGTETVEVPDYKDVPTKTVTRDIVEYDCNPILDQPLTATEYLTKDVS